MESNWTFQIFTTVYVNCILRPFPAGIYVLEVKYRNTNTMCEICSK